MGLIAIKFQDPAYNGGAVSDGFLDPLTGNIIEPGNTNGNPVDEFGWMLAQYQAANAVMDAHLAGLIRGDCAATGITPQSTWEYIGKPLVIMAAAIAGGAAIGAATAGAGAGAGAAAGGSTLAPTVIGATAAPIAAAPVSLGGLATVAAPSIATIGEVGAVGAAAGGGVLSSAGGALLTGAEQAGQKLVLGAALGALGGSPQAPKQIALAPISVTHKPFPWAWILGAVAAGGALLLSGAI